MYIVQSRVNGATRRVSLGRHGLLTLEEARKMAKKELSAMLTGKDTNAEKKRKKVEALTLREIAQKYIETRRELKETSKADIAKHLKTSFAVWADRPINQITRENVAVRFRELSEKSAAQSNQAFRILRALMNYSMAAHRLGKKSAILENPVKILSDAKLWNRIQPRSSRIPNDKIGVAWNLLHALREAPEQTPTSRTTTDIISFLILTGARWNEAAQLTWDRVNLEENWWYLPDPKKRNPVKFPLSHVAREILNARPREGKYVFPAEKGMKGYIGTCRGTLKKVNSAIDTTITAHDLRRTFGGIANECKVELWKAKLLMNHQLTRDVTINSYTETSDLRYLADEIDQIANWINHESIKARDNTKIISMPSKRGE